MKSSHSKIFYLYFSWHNRLSIKNHRKPSRALQGPFRTRKRSKHALNHQIFLSTPLTGATPSFHIVKSSHSKIFYINVSLYTRLSIANHWGPSGALCVRPKSQKTVTTGLKSDISLSIFYTSSGQFSHSEILP